MTQAPGVRGAAERLGLLPLLRGYGRGLVATFFAAAAVWAALLIVLPQLSMLDQALTKPRRQLDSAIAAQLAADAATCVTVLERHASAAAPAPGVPSPTTMVPSPALVPSPTLVPSPGGGGTGLPYILQCDRATTAQRLVRDPELGAMMLDEVHGLPRLAVDTGADAATQIAAARRIEALARELEARLVVEEASAPRWNLGNFAVLTAAVAIPMSPETQAVENARPGNRLLALAGLRWTDADGMTHERLTLVTLLRTLLFAALATALALVACYPIAFKLALGTRPERALWLFLALVIPYAIVELMRVYAWLSIIETNGLVNRLLDWAGVLSIEAGEAIQFKRSPLTVFVVIVYTYILFMAFPMVNVMSTLDRNQIEAARDLGASAWRVHRRVVIPHAKPGIAVGCITVFMLSAGAFSVPRIISRGLQGEWFSQSIYNKFFESGSTNVGAAYAIAFIVVCFLIVAVFMRATGSRLKDFVRA